MLDIIIVMAQILFCTNTTKLGPSSIHDPACIYCYVLGTVPSVGAEMNKTQPRTCGICSLQSGQVEVRRKQRESNRQARWVR